MIPARSKKHVIEQALEKGLVQVFVNSTVPGVVLPSHLMGNPRVILNLSHRFGYKVDVQEGSIQTILSFNGKGEPVVLPWKAIWFIRSPEMREATFFTEDAPMSDLPDDILPPFQRSPEAFLESLEALSKVPQPTLKIPSKALKGIDGEGETTPPRTGHLRLLH